MGQPEPGRRVARLAPSIVALLLALPGLAACASTGAQQQPASPVSTALSQPFSDLGLVRTATPPSLVRSASAPYATQGRTDCAAIASEIAELSTVLGPDLDSAGGSDRNEGEALFADILQSAIGLPYRGAIRRLSGAHSRDRRRARAVIAGYARRGFLRGLASSAHCPAPTPADVAVR